MPSLHCYWPVAFQPGDFVNMTVSKDASLEESQWFAETRVPIK